MTPEQLAELTAWARKVRAESASPEARAAARAILMLAEEVESLRRTAQSRRDDEPPPPSAARALAERLRRPDTLDEGRVHEARAPETAASRERVASTPHDERSPQEERIRRERRARREEEQRRRRSHRKRVAMIVVPAVALAAGTYAGAARVATPDVDAHGPSDRLVAAAQLPRLAFWARASEGVLERLRWTVDGRDVSEQTTLAGDRAVLDGRRLSDGDHTVSVEASGPFPGADSKTTWRLTVDTRPPALRVAAPVVTKGRPVRLAGRTDADATVAVEGKALAVRDGAFTVAYASVPSRPLALAAKDPAGNVARRTLRIRLLPRRPPVRLRGVHVTAFAWATPALRRGVLDLIDQGRINAVELDLKDEAGIVGFGADIAAGRRAGAIRDVYDLGSAVRVLHAKGVWVIGRLVAFRDPLYAGAAWGAGRRAEVVQTPGGGPYAGYGGFTNFANSAVRHYNIDVARVAAAAGVDDILYDYVRRPDGPRASMVFPGLRRTPEESIASFLRETARALKPYDVFLGASVFGVAATRPREVAQDIRAMAREIDYIAPMVYPSHWSPGEYDVASPNAQPYEIVRRSLEDFVRQTDGAGARVVPWLQDFSLGRAYGPAEVRAQIRAARHTGLREFILWDPLVTYTADALDRGAARLKPGRTETPATSPAPSQRPAGRAAAVRANELGAVPVLMYHQIRADGGGDYDLTPAEFRRELEQLYREGYRPVRAVDLVTGHLDVPAGKSPVVLTFDDSTKEQLAYAADGRVKPDTAVGMMLAFARKHPDFKPAGTFFVNREPFGGVRQRGAMLRFLVRSGFEIGNHTDDHIPFDRKDPVGVQRALVRGKRIITRAVPGAAVRTMALPLGVQPRPRSLALRGRWDGESYRNEGVFLVGAGPAPSSFSRAWRPAAIPRIKTGPWHGGAPDFASGFWLDVLRRHPERRYVSDGDPSRISFPRALSPRLAPRFQARANPY